MLSMAFALGLGTMDQVSDWSPAAAWDSPGPGPARAGTADDTATASAALTSSTVRARRCMGLPYAWPGDQDARRRCPCTVIARHFCGGRWPQYRLRILGRKPS